MPHDAIPVRSDRPATERIFVAVDTHDLDHARALVQRLSAAHHRQDVALLGGIKVGLEFFCAHGPAGIDRLIDSLGDQGLPVFLDLKLHDIPNTVAGAIRSAMRVDPAFITIHSAGGPAMISAAIAAAQQESEAANRPCPTILAVTVLTSLDRDDLAAVGQDDDVTRQVLRLAGMAATAGAPGIVCAPFELRFIREKLGHDLVTMVPGLRPGWAARDDQKRVMTPAEAIRLGADYLVIGRPVTQAKDPIDALQRIRDEIEQDLAA